MLPKLNLQGERTICSGCSQPVWRGQQCPHCNLEPAAQSGTAAAKEALRGSVQTDGVAAARAAAAAAERKAELTNVTPRGNAATVAAAFGQSVQIDGGFSTRASETKATRIAEAASLTPRGQAAAAASKFERGSEAFDCEKAPTRDAAAEIKQAQGLSAPESVHDTCVYCNTELDFKEEYCPLDDTRVEDGPKTHVGCFDAFAADPTARCAWCWRPVAGGDGCAPLAPRDGFAPAEGREVDPTSAFGLHGFWGRGHVTNMTKGGAAGALQGDGRLVFHQGCVDQWMEARGSKCLHCNKPVHVGVYIEGEGMVHKGFCHQAFAKVFEEKQRVEAASRLEEFHRLEWSCAGCGDLIADEFYEVEENGLPKKLHPKCWEMQNACIHCNAPITGECYELNEGRLHLFCWEEWHEDRAPTCTHCGQPVAGKFYEEAGGRMHMSCWDAWAAGQCEIDSCEDCNEKILGMYFATARGKLHPKCWHDRKTETSLAAKKAAEGALHELNAEESCEGVPEEQTASAAPSGPLLDTSRVQARFLRLQREAEQEGGVVHRALRPRLMLTNRSMGWMHKQGSLVKSWRRRWATHRAEGLCYFQDDTCRVVKGIVPLIGATVSTCLIRAPGYGNQHGFELVVHTRSSASRPGMGKGSRRLLGFPEQGQDTGHVPGALLAELWVEVINQLIKDATELASSDAYGHAVLSAEQATIERHAPDDDSPDDGRTVENVEGNATVETEEDTQRMQPIGGDTGAAPTVVKAIPWSRRPVTKEQSFVDAPDMPDVPEVLARPMESETTFMGDKESPSEVPDLPSTSSAPCINTEQGASAEDEAESVQQKVRPRALTEAHRPVPRMVSEIAQAPMARLRMVRFTSRAEVEASQAEASQVEASRCRSSSSLN